MRELILTVCYFTVSAVVWADGGQPDASIKVRGRVIDADSDERINDFRLVVGSPYNDIHTTWQSHSLFEQSDGQYHWSAARAWRKTRLRIEAEGYLPSISPLIERRAGAPGNLKIDFKLRRCPGLDGVVRDPSGVAIADAQVALATQTFEIVVDAGKLVIANGDRLGAKIELTDRAGRFRLPPESDPFLIVAAHRDHGFAVVAQSEVKVGKRIDVQLQPWCRITGTRQQGDGEQGVAAYYGLSAHWRADDEWPVLQHRHKTETDDQGEFGFSCVAPGTHLLQLSTSINGARGPVTESWRVQAVAGKTIAFNVRTQVRPVQGKLTLTEQAGPLTFDFTKLKLNVMPQKTLDRRLANPRFFGDGNQQLRPNIGVTKTGEFSISDLPPGQYAVFVEADGDPAGGRLKFTVNSPLIVPLVDEAAAGQPHQLGDVMMFARPIP